MDDDDTEGSRAIPSRTKIGKRAAFLEKFPQYAAPLSILAGLIYVANWPFERLPVAVSDIMLADLPHVKYTSQEKINKRKAEEAAKRTQELQEQTKKFGLGINFSNQKNASEVIKMS